MWYSKKTDEDICKIKGSGNQEIYMEDFKPKFVSVGKGVWIWWLILERVTLGDSRGLPMAIFSSRYFPENGANPEGG